MSATICATMRSFFLAAAVLFVCSSASTGEVASLEIVILRYHSLYAGQTDVFLNGKYEFRFCHCQTEVDRPPPEDNRCVCSTTVPGKAVNIVPVLFSTSCVHSPVQTKCLMSEVGPAQWKMTTGQIYVQVLIDGKPISSPSWQSIPLSKTKRRVRLSCPRSQSACPTCHLCINGAIDLDYVVVFKSVTPIEKLRDLSEAQPIGITKQPFWEKTIDVTKQPFLGKSMGSFIPFNFFRPVPQRPKPKSTQIQPRKYLPKTNLAPQPKTNWVPPPKINYAPQPKNNWVQPPKSNWVSPPLPAAGGNVNRFGVDTGVFRDRIIALHNKYRARHGVASLQHNDTLDRAAQRWADYLAAKQGCLEHEKTDHYGENIYYYATTEVIDGNELAEAVIDAFYEEGEGYNYNRFNKYGFFDTGHFTQMIWKSSTRIGVALSMSHFNGVRRNSCSPHFVGTMAYVVVKYDPPGNIQAEKYYLDNVFPARS